MNYGRWPSRCVSCWWRIFADWQSGLFTAAPPGWKPTNSPTACWVPGHWLRRLRQLLSAALRHSPLATAFAVQLVQRLRDLDPKVRPVLLWLDERLVAQGATADDIVHAEHQQQAAMSVTVRNIITSMRLTSAFDWADFFESVCLVDDMLHREPRYTEMDFVTRDTYRHAIEDLSRGSGFSEIDVTTRVVDRARRAAD